MAAHEEELQVEYLDVLTKNGEKTGISKPRRDVHRDGDYHRAVHIWIYAESTRELLLQQRGHPEDPMCGHWDISCAGHVSAGESSLDAAMRELQEELGISLPKDAFELIFVVLQESVFSGGAVLNNEFDDVYLITTLDPIPLECLTLQKPQVSAVKYISIEEYGYSIAQEDPNYVPHPGANGQYGQLFEIIWKRYSENKESQSFTPQNQVSSYARASVCAKSRGIIDDDEDAPAVTSKEAAVMHDILYLWVVSFNAHGTSFGLHYVKIYKRM